MAELFVGKHIPWSLKKPYTEVWVCVGICVCVCVCVFLLGPAICPQVATSVINIYKRPPTEPDSPFPLSPSSSLSLSLALSLALAAILNFNMMKDDIFAFSIMRIWLGIGDNLIGLAQA